MDVRDGEGEMGEGRARLVELASDGAGRGERGEQLEEWRSRGGPEEYFVDLIGAENVFAMGNGKPKGLVGGELGGELIGGDGEGEVVDTEEAG